MGTRSTTAIKDEQGNQLVKFYRQYDGYVSGHGMELANFLSKIKVINGFQRGQEAGEFANGMGCLAAQMIEHFKDNQIGQIYITSPTDSQEYDYTVYIKLDEEKNTDLFHNDTIGDLYIRVESYAGLLFDGLVSDFLNYESSDEDDEE